MKNFKRTFSKILFFALFGISVFASVLLPQYDTAFAVDEIQSVEISPALDISRFLPYQIWATITGINKIHGHR